MSPSPSNRPDDLSSDYVPGSVLFERKRSRPTWRWLRGLLAAVFILIPLNVAVAPTFATAISICPFDSEVHGAGPGSPTPLDTLANGREAPQGQVTPAELYGSRLPLTAVTGELGSIEGECGIVQATLNPMQNVIMSISQGVASFVIGIYRWATNPEVLGFMLEPIDCLVGGQSTGVEGCNGDGLSGTLFLQFLSLAVMAGAIYMGYRGLVKKRSRDAFQAAIWMIACTGLSLVFMAQPSWFVVKANEAVAAVSNIMTRATTSVAANAGDGVTMCDLTAGDNTDTRSASCHLWRVLVYEPWRSAQFPGSGSSPIPIEDDATREYVMNKFPQLGEAANDLTLAQIDATLVDAIEANDPNYEPQADRERFDSVRAQAAEAQWASGWAGRDTGDRFLGGIMSLIAGLLGGALIAVFAFMSLVYNVTLLILVVVSPVVALLGVFPGTRRIAIKWVEMFIGTVMKRIVLAVVLAVLMGFYSLIAATNLNWLAKIILVCILGIAAFMMRKPLASAIQFGQGSDMESSITRPSGAALAGGVGAVTTLLSGGGMKEAVSSASTAARRRYQGFNDPVGGPVSEGFRDGRARARQKSEQRAQSETSRPEPAKKSRKDTSPSESQGGTESSSPHQSDSRSGSAEQREAPTGDQPSRCPQCGRSLTLVGSGSTAASYCANCREKAEASSTSTSSPRPKRTQPASNPFAQAGNRSGQTVPASPDDVRPSTGGGAATPPAPEARRAAAEPRGADANGDTGVNGAGSGNSAVPSSGSAASQRPSRSNPAAPQDDSGSRLPTAPPQPVHQEEGTAERTGTSGEER